MFKLRLPRRILPMTAVFIVLLTLAAMVACSQEGDDDTREVPAPPATRPVESQRPLTGEERGAVADFASQLQSIDGEWSLFYQEFDAWMSDLTQCLPSTAQESLREFAAGYSGIAVMARNLPRTSTTNELADLIALSADVEETSVRHLRDRWLPGNVALFEAVEQARAAGSRAQNSVRDMIAAKQEELEEGPTAAEIAEMEAFSDDFDEISEAWDDFHDDYAAVVKRESRLETEELLARYGRLINQFSGIVRSIEGLEPAKINEELVDMLQDAAEAELDALEFLREATEQELEEEEEESSMADMQASEASDTLPGIRIPRGVQISFPAQQGTPEPPEKPEGSMEPPSESGEGEPGAAQPPAEPETMTGPTVPPEQPSTPVPDRTTTVVAEADEDTAEEGLSPAEQMAEVIVRAETVLQAVDMSIEAVVEDKSAEQLDDLGAFAGNSRTSSLTGTDSTRGSATGERPTGAVTRSRS